MLLLYLEFRIFYLYCKKDGNIEMDITKGKEEMAKEGVRGEVLITLEDEYFFHNPLPSFPFIMSLFIIPSVFSQKILSEYIKINIFYFLLFWFLLLSFSTYCLIFQTLSQYTMLKCLQKL